MPTAEPTRLVRALALAAASFGLGVAGHLEAGGPHGSSIGLAFGAAYCVLSGWTCSRRRLGPGVLGMLLGNQLLLHVALVLGSGWGSAELPGSPAASAGRSGGAGALADAMADCLAGHPAGAPDPTAALTGSAGTGPGPGSESLAHVAHPMAMHLVPGGWMLLAHLVATLLAAATLLVAEGVCLAVGVLGDWLDRVTAIARRAPLPPLPTSRPVDVPLPYWVTRPVGARPGRGPPAPAVA